MKLSSVASCLAALALLAAITGLARGQEAAGDCLPPEAVAPLLEQAASLLQEGRAEECQGLLRPQRACLAHDSRFAMLLSRAYKGTGNLSWAMKVLADVLVQQPDDCTVRSRLAWLLLESADYRGALAMLEAKSCPETEWDQARWHLLAAEAERQAERLDSARRQVALADSRSTMYAEDVALRSHIRSLLWPMRTPPIELRGELATGWTSNPLLGSPLDPQSSGEDFASLRSDADIHGRLSGPFWGAARIIAEGDLRSRVLYAKAARELSFVGWGVRPGLELNWPSTTLVLTYHYDALWLPSPDDYDGRGLYFDGHRGEMTLQTSRGFYVLAGGGRRTFRVMGRSRWEFDLGLGWGGNVGSKVFLLGGLSGRGHRAKNMTYDLWGSTALLALRWRFLREWSIRASASLALDSYPESAGTEAFHSPGARQDLLVKGRLGLWSPVLFRRLRAGLQYEPSRRISSAQLFDFSDHTILLKLAFGFDADPWHPETRTTEPWSHVGYGLEGGGGALDERLQDLLRSDEESQRGSSCLE